MQTIILQKKKIEKKSSLMIPWREIGGRRRLLQVCSFILVQEASCERYKVAE